ncbi:hypothetical protein FACS189467_8960 [Bacteroidia bacterium]|nr:hypothetical protein FACS189467_8960 [Bacteroidia bacterium]
MAEKKIRRRVNIKYVLKGDANLSHYLWEHKKFIGFVVALVIFYMMHNNMVKKVAQEQQVLRDSITSLKAEATATTTELLLLSSRSEVKKEIKKRGIDLAEPTSPPVILKKDKDE